MKGQSSLMTRGQTSKMSVPSAYFFLEPTAGFFALPAPAGFFALPPAFLALAMEILLLTKFIYSKNKY